MIAIRYENTSTSQNLKVICEILQEKKCEKVTLFASPQFSTNDTKSSDGPDSNFPLVAALVEYRIPGVSKISVVFDGPFLTAARRARFIEVQELLDACEASDKVFYSKSRAPFTSSLSAEDAANTLSEITPIAQLTTETRADYFSLLCGYPESEYPE